MADTFTFTIKPITDLSDVRANVGEIQKAFKKLKLPDKIGEGLNKNITSFFKEFEKYETKVKEGIKSSGDYRQAETSLNKINFLYSEIVKDIQTISKGDLSEAFDLDSGEFKVVSDQIKEIVRQLENIKIDPNKITGPVEQLRKLIKNDKVSGETGILNNLIGHIEKGHLDEAKQALSDLEKYIKKVSLPEGQTERMVGKMTRGHTDAAKAALTEIQQVFTEAQNKGIPLEQTLGVLRQRFQDVQNSSTQSLRDFTKQAGESVEATESLVSTLQKAHKEDFNFDNQVKSIDRQIQSYFGLGQMIRKVGNIARDAFGTIQELDKAMTETAVVTNFDVGDMWEKLPLYTEQANKLGSSIKDVYEATTLYYQQGLNTTQSMGLAVETLKMARIANMSAKDATDAMTAALRGFNLELNQTSAQRINDVYSELAAITASDTQEISTAMEKVASLAHNAGMEVETTSAFLAQMIETTREAPENLGTALKTVVARFQEMKQDPTKLIDSEGVMLDANKVDKALKSIGVNLLDTNGQFRKLDDVFLEIASKWDTMSMGQQRYIATMAAGSRQQSRFIAMMSNYSRTMELVDAAYNSSGASQRQFEKTLESLDAKLNKLKNAWNQFTMGLMNDELLKGGIDLLTIFIDKINDLVDFIGNIPPDPFKGITKSLTTLILTLGGLGAARKVLSRGIESGVGWFRGDMNGKQAITNLFFSPKNALTEAKAEKEAATKAGKEAGSAFSIAYANARDNILKNKPFVPTLAKNGEILNYKQVAGMVGEGTEQQQEALRQYQREEISKEDFAKQVGLSLNKDGDFVKGAEISTTKIAQFSQGVQSAGVALQSFGNILQGTPLAPFGKLVSTTGMLLSNFGGLIAKAATTAAVGVTTASGATVTGIRAIGLAILQSPLTPWILGLMALVAVGKLIYNELTREKREMEALAETAKASSDAFDNLKNSTEELKNSIEEIRNSDNLFDGLVVGTTEWNLALVEANQQILDLIKKYPILQDYLTTDINGRMGISEAGFKAVQDQQNKLLGQAQALDIYNNALHNAALTRQEQDKLLKEEGVQKTKAGTRRVHGEKETISQSQADERNYNALSEEGKQQWKGIEAKLKAEQEAAAKQTMRAALSASGELNDTVLTIFSQNFENAQEAFTGETDMSIIKQAYADFIGGVFDSATGKITDLSGEEVEIENDALKKMYPQIMALLQFQEQAPQVESAVESLGKSFDSIFGNNKGNNFIDDLLNNNTEIDLSALEQFYNMEVDEIVEILGDSGDELAKTILQNDDANAKQLAEKLKENAEHLKETQTKTYKDAAVWYAKAVKKYNAEAASHSGKTLTKVVTEGLSIGGAEAVNKFMSEVSQSFDPSTASVMGQNLFTALLGQPEEAQAQIAELINGVDWTSAIKRGSFYEQFNENTAEGKKAFEALTEKQQTFIQNQKKVDESVNLTGKQFEELVQSSDFLDILSNKWSDFANESGQIDASGIENMAKECGTLSEVLNLAEFDANTLATALNYFQETGSFEGINSATLAAMKHFDDLGQLVNQVKKDIDGFEEGTDYSEGINTYRERMSSLKELYEGGQYSNEKTTNLAKNLFGENWNRASSGKQLSNKDAERRLMQAAPLMAENLEDTAIMAVENLGKGLDIFGKKFADNVDERLDITLKNGELDFDIGDMTQEEVVAEMAKRLRVSEELARGILEGIVGQDWGDVGDNLALDLKRNGRKKGLSDFAKVQNETRGFTTDNQQLTISQSTYDTLLETGGYLEEVGTIYKNRAEAEAALNEQLSEAFGGTITTVKTFNDTADNLDDYLTQKYGTSDRQAKEQLLNADTAKGVGDFDKAVSQLQADGYNYQKAVELVYQQAKDLDLKRLLVDGKELDISDVLNATEFNQAIEEFGEASKWEEVGNIIANTIADVLHEAGIGKGSNHADSSKQETSGKTQNIKTSEETNKKVTIDSQQAEKAIGNLHSRIEDVKKQLAEKRSLGVDVNDREVKTLQNELTSLQAKLRELQNKQINIKYSTSGSAVPSNLPTSATAVPRAKGQNNHISTTGFYAGSSARGPYGTIGPKNKGGLTLTGEKGFEIAWIPSENRSMILGAAGPQMLNLPNDAVIYTHEQSKKIVSQKAIPAGSHKARMDTSARGISSGGGSSSKSSKKKSKKKSKSKSSSKSSSKGEINNFSIEEVVRFNVDQKIATQTAAIEKRTNSIEKALEKIGTTYKDIAGDVSKQVAGVKDLKTQNQALVDSYQRQLAALDKNYKQKVSWTDSKGNSKEKTVNLGDYIKKVGDSYQIDQAKIAKLGSPAEREAVFNAANSALSNLTSGLLNAKKAVDEAEQQLEDFRKQLQDTFYGWENELTKIYNLSQQIESLDLSSDRFSAEIDSTLALVGTQFLSVANAGKRLIEVQKQNASVLTQNIQKQAELIKARRDQLALDIDYADELKAYNNILSTNRTKASKGTLTEQDKIKQNAAYDALVAAQMPTRYATRTKMQDGSYQLDIDWAKLERDRTAGNITDKTYEAIKNGIDKMQESVNEYNQSIIDGFNSLQEIAEQYNNYVETLADLEKEVADAIKDMALNQVARLESLNKSIVDAGKKILDQARKNLQNRRQSEDNAKTEADIAKKENRLAALRANTSGGNQVEIAQLQKEINEARQNYGRTLEDQLLSRLQTQSEEAAAQRQEQIDLAKQQIELNSLNGVYFQEADALLTNVDAHSSEIKDILTTTQEETTGKWGAQVWEQELEQKIGNAITAEAGIPQLASVIQSEGSALRDALVSANASSTSVSGTQSASTASIASNPTIENKAPASTPKASSTPAKSTSSSSSKYPYGKASDTTGNIKKGNKGTQVKAIQYALRQLHYVTKKGKALAVDGVFGADTQYAVKNFQKKRGIKVTGVVNDKTRSKFRAIGYKTGGLADYTGPAWLDGTPSKPEMVLNAQDTKNFIALKDILAGVMHDISHMDSNETYNAPMEFNINVNVDKIANDYDVDKLADRLKKDIVKDMSYRNVTQVRKFR